MTFREILPGVFVWMDTCNVYVLRDGDAALLIDLGDGSVLDALPQLGVKRVEWVLFTHHHREQCQGASRLNRETTRCAGPEVERVLFEEPARFRKVKPALGDLFSVYGASYVRPPVEAVKLDRGFQRLDDFTWRGREFWCVETRGNSPGAMSYLLKREGGWLAFSGDVMLDGARMHTYFDSEFDHGFGAGLYALYSSAALLRSFSPTWLLPAHGAVVRDASAQLSAYMAKLRTLTKCVLRGYEVHTFAVGDQDPLSQPTDVPHIWRITPHLFKIRGAGSCPNFTLLKADSGRALVIDCGLFDKKFLDKCLGLMKERLGVTSFDAVIVTHMHGDHFLEAPHMREKWGAQLWTLDLIADKCQFPERFDYIAPINTYGVGIDSVAFDRLFRPGETFRWEGYELTADWMPGQTEFALCLHGMIDGRRVAFTGDNIFGNPADPAQSGHEAVCARSSAVLEEGYLYTAEYLRKLQPDLIIGAHAWVMDQPREMIGRFGESILALREALRSVSPIDDYRYTFDPYWVRAEPYRVEVAAGGDAEFVLNVRNFRERVQQHRIVIHAPKGLTANPPVLEGSVPPNGTGRFPVKLRAAAGAGVHLVAFDVTLDGVRYGEWFDVVVNVR